MIRRDNGFVSLLTSIIISLLLLAITVSLISLQALTLRKAEDSEQSQVAYFAAESGVEDAVAKIKTGAVGSGGQNCPSSGSQNTNFAGSAGVVGWTCQSITMSGAQSDTIKQPDSAITIDPYGPAGGSFAKITLLWDQTNGNPASYFTSPVGVPSVNFSGGSATWTGHAMPLELTVVAYPSGAFTSASINTQNMLIIPGAGAGTATYSSRTTYNAANGTGCHGSAVSGCGLDSGNPYTARCGGNYTDPSGLTSGVYHCQMSLAGLNPAGNYLFRLQSRFLGDNGQGSGRFVVYFTNSGGQVVNNIYNTTATIDVTGKSGDVYRRVIYKLPIVSPANSGLNNALFSEAGLCQDYLIINGAKSPAGACP